MLGSSLGATLERAIGAQSLWLLAMPMQEWAHGISFWEASIKVRPCESSVLAKLSLDDQNRLRTKNVARSRFGKCTCQPA